MPLAAKRRHRWDAEQRELWTARQKRTEVEWLGKKRVEGDGRELSERKRTVASVRLSELGLRFFIYILYPMAVMYLRSSKDRGLSGHKVSTQFPCRAWPGTVG